MKDLNCPYCNEELEVCRDDAFVYEEDVDHEMQCSSCEKSFVFNTCITFDFTPYKADCLNDGNHIWEATKTWPIEFTKMECKTCGKIRIPTGQEMTEIKKK